MFFKKKNIHISCVEYNKLYEAAMLVNQSRSSERFCITIKCDQIKV